jgi:hypothetical protein
LVSSSLIAYLPGVRICVMVALSPGSTVDRPPPSSIQSGIGAPSSSVLTVSMSSSTVWSPTSRAMPAERETLSEFVSVIVTSPALTVVGNSSAFFLPSAVAVTAKGVGLAAAVFCSSSPSPRPARRRRSRRWRERSVA